MVRRVGKNQKIHKAFLPLQNPKYVRRQYRTNLFTSTTSCLAIQRVSEHKSSLFRPFTVAPDLWRCSFICKPEAMTVLLRVQWVGRDRGARKLPIRRHLAEISAHCGDLKQLSPASYQLDFGADTGGGGITGK